MTNSANQVESVCACCGSPVPQIPGAHRRRRYCDNNGQCKQDAYRKRRKQKRKQEIRERWPAFSQETLGYLEWLMTTPKYGDRFAEGLAGLISKERNRQWRAIDQLRVEELEQKLSAQQEQIAHLEQDHHQFRELLLKVGRTMSYRALPLAQFTDLEPGLYDIKVGKSNWDEASYRLSPYGLAIAIAYARQLLITEQVLNQERSLASDQLFHVKLEKERLEQDWARQKARMTNEVWQREKLLEIANGNLEGAQRYADGVVSKNLQLEREIERYHQICDLGDRQHLEAQAMAYGEQIGFKRLVSTPQCVKEGPDGWRQALQEATDEQLVQIVATARYYAENLIWLDVQEELRQAQRRIKDLEKQVQFYAEGRRTEEHTSSVETFVL
jgi:hypothetical protein